MAKTRDLVLNATGYVVERLDSWLNTAMGFGGTSDKLRHTRYAGTVSRLTDQEITAMLRTEHLAGKIVDVYPREAYREGFEVAGYQDEDRDDPEDDTEEEVCAYLRSWKVSNVALQAAIWGRAYGGACVWLGSYTADPSTPFVMGEQIDFLRVVDRRYLQARPWTLDAQGNPTYYDVIPHEGRGMVGPIHVSRLVMFGGQRTDAQTRQANGYWDDSVLQRPYEALKSDGVMWYAAQQLVSEASIGVLSIKGLYGKIAGPARAAIENRLAFFNASRSVARNYTLDYDGEKFERVNATFAGLSDITREGMVRVSSAAEIPVAILMSDEPGGLNATGDSSIRWWLMRVHAYRTGELEGPTTYLVRALLAQSGIGAVGPDKVEGLSIVWPPLWTPSAAEQADIRLKNSQADASDIDHGIITPEEVALSHYGEDGYSPEIRIDRTIRQPPSEAELKAAAEGATGGTGPSEDGEGASPTGGTGTAAPSDGSGPAGENVQDQVLNGTQVSSLVDIVSKVSAEEIPRDAGIQIIMLAYQVEQPKAEALMGSAGAGFEPKKPDPPPGFGPPGADGGSGGGSPFGDKSKGGDKGKAPPPTAKAPAQSKGE